MRGRLLSIIALLVGPVLAYQGFQAKQTLSKLASEGVETKGVPTEGHTERHRRSSSYKVTVTFPVQAGSPITKEFDVNKAFFQSLGSNGRISVDTVAVKYLPGDPHTAIIVGGSTDTSWMLWVGPIVGLVGGGFLFRRSKS